MSETRETIDPLDPTGMLKGMRDVAMQNWAKMMGDVVNSDVYSQSQGEMLDAWLKAAGPMQKAMEQAMKQSLSNLQMPTRDDIIGVAQRLTNIEMRLDDIEAKLDEQLKAKSGKRRKKASDSE